MAFSELRPFGSGLFAGPQEAAPPGDIASDDAYVLGPGDEILINLWGRADKEFRLTVDREGKIFIPKAGDVVAWGKTLETFKKEVHRRLSKIYAETDLTISLGRIRSIRIFLSGEVARPGAYTVSSLTSLFGALYLAGGPNASGSMRSVLLKRGGETILDKDLYNFLLKGDNSFDQRLESGDVIFVPVAGRRVAIKGEVIRPAIYELKGEETARDLIALAGGATAEAHLERVQLERIAGQSEWVVYDLDLSASRSDDTTATAAFTDKVLMNGDRLSVPRVFQGHRSRVAIFGKVKYPGYYERSDTTTLRGLITRGMLQDYDVYLGRANLFRRYSDWRTEVVPFDLGALLAGEAEDLPLQDRDSVYIYSLQEITWDKNVYIAGEVKRPGPYAYYADMTAQDLIFLAGSYTKGAETLWAEIAHTDSLGQVTVQRVDLSDSAALQTPLKEDDRLYVRQIPEWQLHPVVNLSGEVNFPGEYSLVSRNETLHDLLTRAGGFTPKAFPLGTILLRPSIGERLSRLNLREQLEKSMPLVEDSLGRLERRSFVEYETGAVNRIALDMERLLATDGKQADVALQHGDQILVPAIPSGISVVGAVGINGTLQFEQGKDVNYYVKHAGGFTRRADKNETRLVRANGTAYSGGGTLGTRVLPGDIIAVPTKIDRPGNFTKNLVQILGIATAAATTIIIASRL